MRFADGSRSESASNPPSDRVALWEARDRGASRMARGIPRPGRSEDCWPLVPDGVDRLADPHSVKEEATDDEEGHQDDDGHPVRT